jgi:hypothetical protein
VIGMRLLSRVCVSALLALAVVAGPAAAAGGPTPVRLQFSERSCTFTMTARWHNIGFTPTEADFQLYRFGAEYDASVPLNPGDTRATATFVFTSGASGQFYGNVKLPDPDLPGYYQGNYTKTIVADCE